MKIMIFSNPVGHSLHRLLVPPRDRTSGTGGAASVEPVMLPLFMSFLVLKRGRGGNEAADQKLSGMR